MTAASGARNFYAFHAHAAIGMARDCTRYGCPRLSAPAPRVKPTCLTIEKGWPAAAALIRRQSDLALCSDLNTHIKLGRALVQGRVASGTCVNSIRKLFVVFTRPRAFGALLSQDSELQQFVTRQRQVSRNVPARATVSRAILAQTWSTSFLSNGGCGGDW